MNHFRLFLFGFGVCTSLASLSGRLPAQEAVQSPVKALLICGGCCHDYDAQKGLIKEGLEARARIEVTVVHQGGTGTRGEIDLYKDPQWAEPYDVILHDECFADDRDPSWLARILAPHRAGKPAVMIHCAMHCYRVGTDDWFELCGVTSHGHGPHYPHEVRNVLPSHPIMEGFGPAWFNPAGELYRIEKLWETATPLGTAKDRQNGEDQVCVWTNNYRGTRVFGTTLGHHNETVDHPTFLDLLTRGTLWSAGKLEPGYLKAPAPVLVPENLSLGKKVEASSEQKDQNNLLAMATDGNRGTRWCASGGSFPQWVEVDLESPQKIQGVELRWEMSDATYVYEVRGSSDQENYELLYSTGPAGVRGGEANHSFIADNIRFVRVECLAASPGSWASIREIEVHGTRMQEISSSKTSATETEGAHLLAQCSLAEGFQATIFAAPPAVNYPVFVAASTDGVVFVSSDKNGSLDREARRGSVVRLVDEDGDGTADSSNLFIADVDSPRGLVWDHDRLYLLHPPHLSAFIDEDGDGTSDRQEILVSNIAFDFKDRPADHTSNGVTLGVDGWLYLAIGDFGFLSATGSDGRKLQFRGGGVVRVRPDGTGLELYSRGTRNILEVALDPLLRGYARDNTNDGGGWDIRLHHFTGLEDHGYPCRYLHFADEVVAPLAQYGGGSGCGALYLDEPGMPAGFGDALYTADWGRERIYRHRLVDNGATVQPDQTEFLGIPRVTDLDVDGNSQIFAASWRGATFTYAGEDVGFLVRVTPTGYRPEPLPDFQTASLEQLGQTLRGASHRRRLEAQRALIRRAAGLATARPTILALLDAIVTDPQVRLASRVAALFAVKQIEGAESLAAMTRYSKDPSIAAWAIRALADRWDEMDGAAAEAIHRGLQASDPRTLLESIVAAGRLGPILPTLVPSLGNSVSRVWGADDLVIEHTAIEASIRMGALDAAVAVLENQASTLRQRAAAYRVLQGLHGEAAIDYLERELLAPSISPQLAFAALCRLALVEGSWNGASWGTRPDARGPYYQGEPWEQSPRILEILDRYRATCSVGEDASLLMIMAKNRIAIAERLPGWLQREGVSSIETSQMLDLFGAAESLPLEAGRGLVARLGSTLSSDERSEIFSLVLRNDFPTLTESLLESVEQVLHSSSPADAGNLIKQMVEARSLGGERSMLLPRMEAGGSLARIATLVGALRSAGSDGSEDQSLGNVVERVWADEKAVLEILDLLLVAKIDRGETLVRRAMIDSRPAVAARGKVVAEGLKLADLAAWTGPKIGELERAKVLQEIVHMPGNAQRGLQVFQALGCAKCHDTAPTDSLRGPYLPNVAKTYQRGQLAEAILMPSKSIAQGFVQNVFVLDDGRVLAGFVTAEGASQITIRNSEGNELRIAAESIEQRSENQTSVMPEGLANSIPPAALADLVSYLESLGK